jgi:PAS domain S-box-containing protein
MTAPITAWTAPAPPRRGYAQQNITLVYAAVGAAWIALSDLALGLLELEPGMTARVQTVKGWVFVAATTLLLYWLVRRATKTLERAHDALREKHRALWTLLDHVPGLVYRCADDADWTMEFLSEGCRGVTGHAPDALLGNRALSYEDLIDPRDRARVRQEVRRGVEEGRAFKIIYRIRDAAGRERWVSEQGSAVGEDESGAIALEGCVFDVSDVKRMEQRLAASQRMERLGDMAGSIAHDFNNYLTIIRAYAGMLKPRHFEEDSRHESLEHIVMASERAGKLVEQLLSFARQRPQNPVDVDVAEAVERVSPLLARLAGPKVKIEARLDPPLPAVKIDPVQLEQVLMNLVSNARDAIEGAGVISLTATFGELGPARAEEASIEPGPYVTLAVRDTGAGIPEEVLSQIFEPYFTTKGEGGTGLGLATVYGIVKQAAGGIIVESRFGEGTTFEILLPAAEAAQASEPGEQVKTGS